MSGKNVYGRVHGKAHGLKTTRFENLQNSKRELISYFNIFWYCKGMKLNLVRSICLIRERKTELHFLGMQVFYKSQQRVVLQISLEIILMMFTDSAKVSILSPLFFLFILPLCKYFFDLQKIENCLSHSRYSIKFIKFINGWMDTWVTRRAIRSCGF